MADDEQFSLCWNNFNSNLSAGFHESLCRGDLVDVTLAAEGQFVKAHRLVLSVCSPYFRKMFTQMPANQHAFVFLKDVSHTALKDLIQFMYCGEVNVKQEALPAFISTAEALQIKGLTDSDPPSQSPAEQQQSTPQLQQISSQAPRVRQRPSTSRSYKLESVDDSGDDNKPQTTQIVIQTTAAPASTQVTTIAPQQQSTHLQHQMVALPPSTTVVSHKRPAQRTSIGGTVPHIKRTKSTIDPLETSVTEAATAVVSSAQQPQQITVQTATVSVAESKSHDAEYIDLPIELPTKSEPDYADETGDVESTYVEDDSYGDLRYDESYFTENEDGNAQTTAAVAEAGNTSSAVATTSKAIVKQQQASFSDTSFVDAGDQANSDAQESSVRRRGRPKKSEVVTFKLHQKPAQTVLEKIEAAVKKSDGKPLIYVSSTKGAMKILYDGHHFKYTFRKGQYSMFQCCFKENKEECKVKVVSDQRKIYHYEGEHTHFMQAVDKSVTSEIIEPFLPKEEPVDEDATSSKRNSGNTVKVIDQQVLTPASNFVAGYEVIHCFETGDNNAVENKMTTREEPNENVDVEDFRDKIKKRLQKALMGKSKK